MLGPGVATVLFGNDGETGRLIDFLLLLLRLLLRLLLKLLIRIIAILINDFIHRLLLPTTHELKYHHVSSELLLFLNLLMRLAILLVTSARCRDSKEGATPHHLQRQPVVVNHAGAHRDRISLRRHVPLLLLLKD